RTPGARGAPGLSPPARHLVCARGRVRVEDFAWERSVPRGVTRLGRDLEPGTGLSITERIGPGPSRVVAVASQLPFRGRGTGLPHFRGRWDSDRIGPSSDATLMTRDDRAEGPMHGDNVDSAPATGPGGGAETGGSLPATELGTSQDSPPLTEP